MGSHSYTWIKGACIFVVASHVRSKPSHRAKDVVQMAKIYIVFYSMYGHVQQMAKAVKEGVDKVPGCQGILYQVCSKHTR